MMRRPLPTGSGLLSCQICGLINRQQISAAHSAKRPSVTLDAGRRLARLPQACTPPSIQSRFFSTSPSRLKAQRSPVVQSQNGLPRFAKSPASSTTQQNQQNQQQIQPAEVADLAAAVDRVTETFVAQQGIPSEHMTLTALQACTHAAGKLQLDTSHSPLGPPQIQRPQRPQRSQNQSLNILGLDPDNRKGGDSSEVKATPQQQDSDLADKISGAAYTIISHPTVVITPQVLQKYIALQARLGKPESLPHVLELFASKPTPTLVSGSIRYTDRNPNSAKNAIEPQIAEAALDAAIAARNMDAAIGVVESTYGSRAFKYAKALSKALFPATLAGGAPIAIYLGASQLAKIQEAWNPEIFTNVAFAGIMCYYVCTGTIGLVALATANDQMKRVTWGEGIPLWERWLREEERAAYDKIACSFGFASDLRAGEEEGLEFGLLREFILCRGMILDKVDLMPGMN
ncbi:hypothetical protein V8F20_000377 [Naviculisporaceae sp. PSN 640]